MMKTTCGNCGNSKAQAEWSDPYCSDCTAALKEAREYAVRENLDVSAAQREALRRRGLHVHANRPDPRVPFEKQGQFNISGLGMNAHVPPSVPDRSLG